MNETVILENITLEQNRMHISGKATPMNAAGSRNFSIRFDLDTEEDLVDQLIARNWPIKKVETDRDGNPLQNRFARLKVNINYKFRPPRFEQLIKIPAYDKNGNPLYENDDPSRPYFRVKSEYLDEEESKIIDDIDIKDIDVALNLWTYKKMDGSEGYCVYLKEMRFTKSAVLPTKKENMDILLLRPDLKDVVSDCPFDVD